MLIKNIHRVTVVIAVKEDMIKETVKMIQLPRNIKSPLSPERLWNKNSSIRISLNEIENPLQNIIRRKKNKLKEKDKKDIKSRKIRRKKLMLILMSFDIDKFSLINFIQ